MSKSRRKRRREQELLAERKRRQEPLLLYEMFFWRIVLIGVALLLITLGVLVLSHSLGGPWLFIPLSGLTILVGSVIFLDMVLPTRRFEGTVQGVGRRRVSHSRAYDYVVVDGRSFQLPVGDSEPFRRGQVVRVLESAIFGGTLQIWLL